MQQRRARPTLRRGLVDRLPRRREHRLAAARVHVQHPHAEARGRGAGARDGVGMSWNLRSRKTSKPRSTIHRTGSGPATTKSSLPTLSAARRGIEPGGQRERGHRIGEIERDDTRGDPIVSSLHHPGDRASCVAVRRFGAPRRIGFPLAAPRAPPVVLLRSKAAVLALVHPEALDVLRHQALDQLQVVATLGGRREQLRFEQPVEAEQRRDCARARP